MSVAPGCSFGGGLDGVCRGRLSGSGPERGVLQRLAEVDGLLLALVQFGGGSTIELLSQDGMAIGTLQGVKVSGDGIIRMAVITVLVNVRMDNDTLWRMNVVAVLVKVVRMSSIVIMFVYVRV